MAGRQVKPESILHRGPSEHDAGTHWEKKGGEKKGLILISSIHTRHRGCAPLSLVASKASIQTLVCQLHLAIMKQSRTCVLRTRGVRRRKRACALACLYSLDARMFVHLQICIKGPTKKGKSTFIRFLCQAAFDMKANKQQYQQQDLSRASQYRLLAKEHRDGRPAKKTPCLTSEELF